MRSPSWMSDKGMDMKYKDMSGYLLPLNTESTTYLPFRDIPTAEHLPPPAIPGVTRGRLESIVPGYTFTPNKAVNTLQTETFIDIVEAIESLDHDSLQEILDEGITRTDIIDPSSKTTVLHVAAKRGTTETWEILFSEPEIRNCIDMQDTRGTSPLIAASWYNNTSAVKFLLENGANIHLYIKDTKRTALHCAADHVTDEVTKLLLSYSKKKVLIDAMDFEGNTPLMLAVKANSPSITALLEAGADYAKKNVVSGRNVLHMAIINNEYSLITTLTERFPNNEFLDALDKNGDSPFMLAIRLDNDVAVNILLRKSNLPAVLSRSLLCLHTIVEKGKTFILETLLKAINDKTIFNFMDDKGRTVLIHAIERCEVTMVHLLLHYGVNYKVRNYSTGETVLHAAAYANDEIILDAIFSLNDVNEIVHVRDHKGFTAYDIVLGKSGRRTWLKFMESGLIDHWYKNPDGESSLFIAAKEGNIFLVMSLLLSGKFNNYFGSHPMTMDKNYLLVLELEGLIYASDVYLCTGYDVGKRRWKLCPEQDHLFARNVHGQNIFHACSLGENDQCASLIYRFCTRFNDRHHDFDRPDNYGNTPFMFAIECGSRPLVSFYMKLGVNLAHENRLKQMPLGKLNNNLAKWKEVIVSVIEESTVLHQDPTKKDVPFGELTIHYDILCPKGVPQMRVTSNLFKKLKGEEGFKILESSLVEYFVMTKWSRVRHMVGLRFLIYTFFVICLSTYLSFSLCLFLGLDPLLEYNFRRLLTVLSILMLLLNFPLMFMKRRKRFILVFLSPVCTLLYLFMKTESRGKLEFGAIAVLFGWLSIVAQGYVTRMSFQIAMFFEVIKAVIKHLPLCLLLILAFSNCFFVLFHDFPSFSNPFYSFFTTGVSLLSGENVLPPFNEGMKPFPDRPNIYQKMNSSDSTIDGEAEMRGMLIEGSILMAFDILITICVLNMLTGLAIRSGDELEKEGNIHRIRAYVEEVTVWEHLVSTRFYRFVSWLHLLFMFGLKSTLKDDLEIPITYRPMSGMFPVEFNLQKLRYTARDSTDRKTVEIPSFKQFLTQERSEKTRTLRRGSRASSNIAWIYRKWDFR